MRAYGPTRVAGSWERMCDLAGWHANLPKLHYKNKMELG